MINEETNTSVIAGGQNNPVDGVEIAVENVAKSITTSDRHL